MDRHWLGAIAWSYTFDMKLCAVDGLHVPLTRIRYTVCIGSILHVFIQYKHAFCILLLLFFFCFCLAKANLIGVGGDNDLEIDIRLFKIYEQKIKYLIDG